MSDLEHGSIIVEYVPISELTGALYNPRKWDKTAKEKLTESITRFGFVDPIILNGAPERKNIIIGGHMRVEVARDLGMTTVPAVYVNISDIAREKELNLRLHRNTGEFDFELLKQFDLTLLLDVGFNNTELANVWAEIGSVNEELVPKDKEIQHGEPITKLGDMFQLGEHRLICDDSQDPAVVTRLMGEDRADMIDMDPPFNTGMSYSDGVSTKGKYPGDVDDSLSDEAYEEFVGKVLANALSVTKPDAHVFYWCDQRFAWLFQQLYRKHGVQNKRICIWIKNNFCPTPQVAFNKATEFCVYGTLGKPFVNEDIANLNEILNQNVDSGNRAHDDIIDIFDIWLAKRDPSDEYEHPTQKPLNLHEKPLKRCTKLNDIVLDLFGGSGSLLLSCEQMKRRARLCEKNPAFCDLIIKRFEGMTGQKAVKLND